MKKTSAKQRIGLIILGILLALIILESGMRITGAMILLIQRSENELAGDAGDVYRILALGESTTADHFSNTRNSWPRQLEIMLNNRSSEIKFKVFNEGIPGITTAFILSRLEENLEKYNPDMVITMMGVNDDGTNLIYNDKSYKLSTKIAFLVEDLRTYKLTKLLLKVLENKINDIGIKKTGLVKADEQSIKNDLYKEAEDYFRLGLIYYKQGIFEQAEAMFFKALEINPEINPNDHKAYILLGRTYFKRGMLEESEEMLKKALEINPDFHKAYLDFHRTYPNFHWAYIELGWTYQKQNRSAEDIEKFYREGGFLFSVTNISDFEITQYHYQQLYDVLKKRGIKYVAMQYPTLSVDTLKGIFRGYEDIIFVSNEDNFKKALGNAKYEDYFLDNVENFTIYGENPNFIFRGNYGHTTLKGTDLIAENLANVILKELRIIN